MQKEDKGKTRIILTLMLGIAGIALFGYVLSALQSGLVRRNMQEEMKETAVISVRLFQRMSKAGRSYRPGQTVFTRPFSVFFFLSR